MFLSSSYFCYYLLWINILHSQKKIGEFIKYETEIFLKYINCKHLVSFKCIYFT